jgi:N-acyl-D-amino-acid deacylase
MMKLSVFLVTTTFVLAQDSRPTSAPEVFDLVIRGAQVIDGTGAPPATADVGVRGERIVRVGDLSGVRSPQILEARGLVLAPGFIDLHTHADYEIFQLPSADNFLRMGVTTIITGNCGSSVENVGEHLAALAKQGVSLNYGTLVGHGTVRALVMQTVRRAPKTAELVKMEDLVAKAMIEGAFGMSTGLIYVPGTYAKTPELVSLAKVVHDHRGIYVSHMRNEGREIDAALDEIFTISKEASIPVHVSHLKSAGRAVWGRAPDILKKIEDARTKGLAVTADQYAYDASSTSLDVLFESDDLDVGRRAFGDKLGGDAAFRARIEAGVLEKAKKNGFDDLGYAAIANAPNHAELNGLTLAEAADRLVGARTPADQARAATTLMIDAKGSKVGMVYHGMNDADVRTFMKCPWVAVASDAGVITTDGSKPHPRGSGNNVRVLGRFVREAGVIRLEEAVRKMTSLPATIFGIRDRGVIREGAFADLVLFDPATVVDRATYESPRSEPVGIKAVIVNGTVVVDDGRHSKLRTGAVLRHARSG